MSGRDMRVARGAGGFALVLGLVLASGCAPPASKSDGSIAKEAGRSAVSAASQTVADAAGNMHVPSNYRATYRYLGTWSVAADTGQGAQQLHSVYVSPGGVESHRAGGRFADGTVLVKEVYGADTMSMTTGTVSHAGKLMGWFVMIKDSKNSHPANKLWGDGWGWAWFDADQPKMTKSTDYQNDCKGCHEPARAQDWTYIKGYPALAN